MKIGKIYKVKSFGIGPASGLLFVKLEGYEHGPLGCQASCFKKLSKASDEFTEQMRKLKPHKQKVEARCPITGQPLSLREMFESECG